ncbi:uncharacterized protein LOC131234899 isoform X2 [Magnolia sinica]|nr:uncharacterized protein LOC131234899 isoform X2 [Magnolia sinica]
MLGLDMPLHQHQQHQHQIVSFATDHQSQTQQQQQAKHPFAYNPKGKQQQQQQQQQMTVLSDEDDQDGDTQSGGASKRVGASPWQRMKWTDSMVRLLIMMVYYVGDDGGGAATENDPVGKKKGVSGGGLLQKKGKWKSVSRAMMEKGFYVSPQQCEDKFNDLNKRYKRVNDILGKGTACRVVENQSLLDTMDQLSPKMKEEVRKLLNSKHLFFREMCAYHSSSSGANAGGVTSAVGLDQSSQQQLQQQRCFHSSESIVASAGRRERGGREEEEEERDAEEEEEEDDYDDDDDEEDEDEIGGDGGVIGNEQRGCHGHEDEKGLLSTPPSNKRQRPWSKSSSSMQQLSCELMGMMQDGTKSPWEQRQWLRNRAAQLEEQRVGYQCQAFELEKQRLKWLKFSGKKERELERLKLDNERMRLENERMVLLLRHKELELDLHSRRPDHPSSITTG